MSNLNEDAVLETLRKVKYPGFSRDIVSFGFVKDVAVGGGNVSVRLSMTTASTEIGEQIRAAADAALREPGRDGRACPVEPGIGQGLFPGNADGGPLGVVLHGPKEEGDERGWHAQSPR